MDIQRSLFDDFDNNNEVVEQKPKQAEQPTGDQARILELRDTLAQPAHHQRPGV